MAKTLDPMSEETQDKRLPSESASGWGTDFTVEDISAYYEEMVRAGVMELEVETAQGRLVLKRSNASAQHAPSEPAVVLHQHRRKSDSGIDPQAASLSSGKARSGKAITSPIMGVFYRSSSPQAAPFVKEGDVVAPGATLCIVEAMKVMNEIKADAQYKIIKISVDNSKPITQGQELFWVEPA
jgi:acetyl-CoA carboxylase biotin carboxyl carrier protein